MHYKNGREAHVGDPVVGKCLNTEGIVAGTLVSLTPGPDACSAMVGFVKLKEVSGKFNPNDHAIKLQGCMQHGHAGPLMAAIYKQDYTECKYMLHAEDVFPKE